MFVRHAGHNIINGLVTSDTSSVLKICPNQEYMALSGAYPPFLSIYDLNELSVKCSFKIPEQISEFHVACHILILFLQDDWKRILALSEKRKIFFLSENGLIHTLQLPKVLLYFSQRVSWRQHTVHVMHHLTLDLTSKYLGLIYYLENSRLLF
mgnify:CR=1 FL=1